MKSGLAKKNLKVALAQLDIAWENPAANRDQAILAIKKAANQGADLVVFPEMFLTGFSLRVEKYSSLDEIKFFKKLARINQVGIIIGLGMKKNSEHSAANQALVISKTGKILSQYQKIHPFTFAGEHKAMPAGNKLPIFKINGFRAATVICYDLRFPGLFEALAKQKVDLIFVIANWPAARIEDWKTLLRARALDTQSFVVGVNRVGSGNQLSYPGYSSVYGPRGEKIREMTAEGIEVIDLDLNLVQEARKSFPSLKDKRFDLYLKINR